MIEMIATSLFDARAIERGGADRIELVEALSEGGLTPSYELVEAVLHSVRIPVNVMLRPHARSFQYSKEDLHVMRKDAIAFEAMGVGHVVLGILDERGQPDLDAMEEVLSGTSLTATFHRAIDASKDPYQGLQRLKESSRITHVLSSGGPGKAEDNLEVLGSMLRGSGRITLIIGSGVTKENLEALYRFTSLELKQMDGGKVPDFHVGTGVRHGRVGASVDEESVGRFMELFTRISDSV